MWAIFLSSVSKQSLSVAVCHTHSVIFFFLHLQLDLNSPPSLSPYSVASILLSFFIFSFRGNLISV
ncbi:hypothetical protein F5H01DRAFT_345600 [Linnemannia elongata]|nr:hypothetical protein F5H01DRAFT_345600 [Linnemannia elongata]